ncbi:MAG: ATP-binding protein [Alphaproteobacteria bacterium]|jgi:predicted AAA+ superfamily ATPase|nr:ATP-binding protein [Alphaproteobacteria bacterium]
MTDTNTTELLTRIADALDRIAPPAATTVIPVDADAFTWQAETARLEPVAEINRLDIEQLIGINRSRDTLLDNTRRFAAGYPANNALLWGARGMGKSSLVKAVHGTIAAETEGKLVLVEIHREDLSSLPRLLAVLRESPRRFILFCDDLSFDADDTTYKSLKAMLEGGIEGRPKNVLFYATSNRRHLMPRDMIENESSTGINPGEAVEEKVSLSDRFGLWLGFHNCDQDTFFEMLDDYVARYSLDIDRKTLRAEAIEWSMTRGARSGRVAWQYIQDLAGRQKKQLD